MVKGARDMSDNVINVTVLQRSSKINKNIIKPVPAIKHRDNAIKQQDKENNVTYALKPEVDKFVHKIPEYYLTQVRDSLNSKGDRNDQQQRYIKHFQFTRKCFNVIRKLPPQPENVIRNRLINSRKILVLDLDETLIHTFDQNPPDDCVCVNASIFNQTERTIHFKVRPYCYEFLHKMSKYYELCVFTAGHSTYANPIINYLDPSCSLFKQRFFNDSCTQISQFMLKNLNILNCNLKDIVIVDNTALCFGFQKENGVPVVCYNGESTDIELIGLARFLVHLSGCDDVRLEIMRHFKWDMLQNLCHDIESLVKYYF